MEFLDEKKVLDHYLELIDREGVAFLAGRPGHAARVRADVAALRGSSSLHERIQAAKAVWKSLFEAAMSFIDPDKRGYDEIFAYFDRYVDFEELIFASDSFYRDHTLHCLWVYFLGEWIAKRPEFAPFVGHCRKTSAGQMALVESISSLKGGCPTSREGDAEAKAAFAALDKVISRAEGMLEVILFIERIDDAQRCVAALTHDLGYPLKKIAKINKAISGVLPAFSIRNFAEFSFDFSPIQLGFVDDFIRFMCLEFSFRTSSESEQSNSVIQRVFDSDEATGKTKANREALGTLSPEELRALADGFKLAFSSKYDASSRLRYSSDFEQYEHGIMSAFLLAKTIESFRSTRIVYTDYTSIDFSERDFPSLVAKQGILQSVTEHTSPGFRIGKLGMGSSWLILMDEIEEFSRISRASQSRQFVEEFCKTRLYMEDRTLCADFVFDNGEIPDLDPALAFKGKAKRFLSMFDVAEMDEGVGIRVRFEGRVPKCRDVFELELGRDLVRLSKNGEPLDIPAFLGSRQYWTSEEYASGLGRK